MFLKNRLKRLALYISIGVLILTMPLQAYAAPRLQDTKETPVIVIDPGHGGANEGTIAGAYPEKQMTLVSAMAMYEELIQFDNVEVYMTRTEDVDLSLEKRAEFAASLDADFLFSIHYNASEYHTLFGSEVWVSYEPPYNAYGYQFGHVQMQEMQDMGLFLRGIKTKANEKGTDYYGILRHAAARSIPAVIIEHCHVDEARDIPFCETEAEWVALGQADARAVAKYFGLSSKTLGIDYSEEANRLPDVNEDIRVQSTIRDETPPDVCMLELLDADYDSGEINIQVTATDYDSPLLYYDYSVDGGKSYCPLIPWPDLNLMEGSYSDTFQLHLTAEPGSQPEIILRAYNFADLYTESRPITFLQRFYYNQDATDKEAVKESYEAFQPERHTAGTDTFTPVFAAEDDQPKEISILTFLQICLVFVIILFSVVLIAQTISYHKRKKRRRQRRKELESNRYQKK